jgi:uncharacterized membrane protein
MPDNDRMLAVYIPTAPNPTSGYIIMIDKGKVQPVNVKPEEAFTWAVSAGVVTPGSEKNTLS